MASGSTEFLQHFPREYRGRNGHFFYHAVRCGLDSPKAVCSLVYRTTAERLKKSGLSDEQRLSLEELKRWMQDDREGALALAQYCLDWEQASPAERKAKKEREAEAGKREWMAGQPPTEKQLALLVKLGHTAEVFNRLDASELIEKLKTW